MTHFDQVYQTAKSAFSLEDLKTKLDALYTAEKDLYLDEKQPKGHPYLTPAVQLAIDGYDQQVEWLRELGASVDGIALGFAMARNHDKVKEYHTQYGADTTIAQGYALVGEDEKVEEYRTKHHANVHLIVQAYAFAGNKDRKVELYWQSHGAHINQIVLGFVLAKNKGQVLKWQSHLDAKIRESLILVGGIIAGDDEVVKKYKQQRMPQEMLYDMAFAYALVGNHEEVEKAQKLNHQVFDEFFLDQDKMNDRIVVGYASVGNHNKVKEYHDKKHASPNVIVQAYATAGYDLKVEEYCALPDINLKALREVYLTEGKKAEHFARILLRGHLKSYLFQRTNQRDSSGKTKEYLHSRLFPCQKSFTQKKHVVELLTDLLNGVPRDITDKDMAVLRDGNLGKKLRKFAKAGYLNELAGKEVNTVHDFIKALQAKTKSFAPVRAPCI